LYGVVVPDGYLYVSVSEYVNYVVCLLPHIHECGPFAPWGGVSPVAVLCFWVVVCVLWLGMSYCA
jgi:hypothetical protein